MRKLGCWAPFVLEGLPSVPSPHHSPDHPCEPAGGSGLTFGLPVPQGKAMDFVDVDESNARWVQDFRLKAYASPAKLESIDGEGPRAWRPGRMGLQGAVAPQLARSAPGPPGACWQAL